MMMMEWKNQGSAGESCNFLFVIIIQLIFCFLYQSHMVFGSLRLLSLLSRLQLEDPEKLCIYIRGLEGRGEGLWEAFDYLWAAKGLYWELDSFQAKALRNPDYISTCMIIQRWGFRLVLSPGYIFCVMCVWFLHISYMCSYWCCSWLIKLPLNCL